MNGRRQALIVANDEYTHEGLRRLRSPAADADALGRVLGDPQIGGFAVRVLRNEPDHVIEEQVDELLDDAAPDDMLLVHFSCHGLKDESGRLFFAARNTLPNRLNSTAVSAEFVQECMRRSRSRVIVLLLDCCYGGAFARGVRVRAGGDVNVLESFPQQKLGGGRGRAVITASSAMEYAFDGEQLADDNTERPALFTAALVEGLESGEADRDEDGWISLNELYDYVFDRVRAGSPHQTPSRVFEMQGDLYVARSRRRRVRASAIPTYLENVIAESSRHARLGAVDDLQALLLGEDVSAAAGAFDRLTQIVHSDVRDVARKAEDALVGAAVQPEMDELRVGPVVEGSPSPVHLVRLLGPPLARVCTAEPSDARVQVREASDGFEISVDTDVPGSFQGSVSFKGYTGAATVTVDVDVRPREQTLPVGGDLPVREDVQPTPPPPRAEPASPRPVPSPGPPPPLEPANHHPHAPAAATRGWRTAFGVTGVVAVLSFVGWLDDPYYNNGLLGVAVLAALVLALLVGYRFWSRRPAGLPSTEHARRPPGPAGRRPKGARAAAAGHLGHTVPTFRVIALGVAGSGKTLFLAGMFHTLHVPAPGRSHYLETDVSSRIRLSRIFDEMSAADRPWPAGTRQGETREFDFDCVSSVKGERQRLFRLSYLDFAGELLEIEQEAGSTVLGELEERIRDANILFGMLDGHRVAQLLRDEPAGRRYFQSTLQPLIGILAGARCPIHFVLTKWDLLQHFGEPVDADASSRLRIVRDALLSNAQFRALVDTHSWGSRVVRLLPVSAVGPDFARIDADGRIIKRSDGEVHPVNVDAPLTVAIPDLFAQTSLQLEPSLRRKMRADLQERDRLEAAASTSIRSARAKRPLDADLREVLQGFAGRPPADRDLDLFLSWMGNPADTDGQVGVTVADTGPRQALVLGPSHLPVLTGLRTNLESTTQRLPASVLTHRK
jgi:hypothetical protein